jgi:hypothetical protein
MNPPLISYVTFNRLGLTIKNISSILNSNDDFEMHIIDNNSSDDTWKYIQSIEDSRIKSKTRIGINTGLINALNINLTKRKPDQYFITLDNDVYIETTNWITNFMKVFNEFPEVGLLGVQNYQIKSTFISKSRNEVSYLELTSSLSNVDNYVPGSCMFIRPELLDKLGYFCEENSFGDMEICYRVNNYTSFKCGFVTNVKMTKPQIITCDECLYKNSCKLDKNIDSCFIKHSNLYKNDEFRNKFKWKFDETIIDMKSGARSVYCASSNDPNSLTDHIFNSDWALENLNYYIENAN